MFLAVKYLKLVLLSFVFSSNLTAVCNVSHVSKRVGLFAASMRILSARCVFCGKPADARMMFV